MEKDWMLISSIKLSFDERISEGQVYRIKIRCGVDSVPCKLFVSPEFPSLIPFTDASIQGHS